MKWTRCMWCSRHYAWCDQHGIKRGKVFSVLGFSRWDFFFKIAIWFQLFIQSQTRKLTSHSSLLLPLDWQLAHSYWTAFTSQLLSSPVLNTFTILSMRKVLVEMATHSRAWIPPSTQIARVWSPRGEVPIFIIRIFLFSCDLQQIFTLINDRIEGFVEVWGSFCLWARNFSQNIKSRESIC